MQSLHSPVERGKSASIRIKSACRQQYRNKLAVTNFYFHFCSINGVANSIYAVKMETYIPRFQRLPAQHCFLFGPRGTGKSTFLKSEYPDALWIDLLAAENFRRYSAHPERLEELVLGNPQKGVVVIDEVQRVPGLLPMVHRIIEMKTGHQFVLTGSSARKLKRADVDLLGGRAVRKSMFPFMVSELPGSVSLQEALRFGLLPVAFFSADKPASLDAYISLYMQQEVYQESLVRNIGDFSRFLEAASFSHAAVLNISNSAGVDRIRRATLPA